MPSCRTCGEPEHGATRCLDVVRSALDAARLTIRQMGEERQHDHEVKYAWASHPVIAAQLESLPDPACPTPRKLTQSERMKAYWAEKKSRA